MIRLLIGLLVLGVLLDAVWPQSARDQAAAGIAHSICSQRPQPRACAPDGHPSDVLKPALGLSTPAPRETNR